MTVKLLTEHHLRFLSLKGGCTDSSESTLVKVPHCWKSHVTAQMLSGLTCWCTLITYIPKSMGKTRNKDSVSFLSVYSKTCLKQSLKKRTQNIGDQYRLSLNAGQKYCRMLQYFRPPLSYHFPLRPWFSLFLSGRLRQVLLYTSQVIT